MRLGAQDVLIEPKTLAAFLFDDQKMVRQRFRHRYEVEPAYIERLSEAGLCFSGKHPEHPIMQVLELPAGAHPYFIAAQFHPELTSRPLHPHPMFLGLIAAGIARAHPELSPRDSAEVVRWLRSAAAAPGADRPSPVGQANPAGRMAQS